MMFNQSSVWFLRFFLLLTVLFFWDCSHSTGRDENVKEIQYNRDSGFSGAEVREVFIEQEIALGEEDTIIEFYWSVEREYTDLSERDVFEFVPKDRVPEETHLELEKSELEHNSSEEYGQTRENVSFESEHIPSEEYGRTPEELSSESDNPTEQIHPEVIQDATKPLSLWHLRVGGGYIDVGSAIAVDKQDNVIFTGFFGGTVKFGTVHHTVGGNGTLAWAWDLFVAKLDSNGKWLWARHVGDSGNRAHDLTVDAQGNIIITGFFFFFFFLQSRLFREH